MARGVDDVDAVVVPDTRRCSRCDRDATLLLLGHVVHGCRAVVNFADLVTLTRVKQNAFSGRRFTSINVGHNADIASAL